MVSNFPIKNSELAQTLFIYKTLQTNKNSKNYQMINLLDVSSEMSSDY